MKRIGIYHLGCEEAELFLRDGTGGDVELCPGNGRPTKITLGGDYENWREIVDSLIHEVMELVMIREGLRFSPDPNHCSDMSNFIFCMNHVQYTNTCARVGMFIAECLPDLATAWGRWKKGRK